jgi:hypothetical protein
MHTHISPFDFGAAGNGTTDDTTAVQRALNRAIATGLPLLLDGIFKTTSGLSATGSVTIVGIGMETAKIVPAAGSYTALTIHGDNIRLSGFSVLSPAKTATGILLQAATVGGARVDSVSASGSTAFSSPTVDVAMFTNCVATDCTTGFEVANSQSGCIGCLSSATSTNISAVTGQPIDIGNSWTPDGTSPHAGTSGDLSYAGAGTVSSSRICGVPFQSDFTAALTVAIPNGTTSSDVTTVTFTAALCPNGVTSVVASRGYVTAIPGTRQVGLYPPATTSGTTTVCVLVTGY